MLIPECPKRSRQAYQGVDLMNWTRILGIIISLTITTFLGSCEVDDSTTIYYPDSDDNNDPVVSDCEVVVNYPHSATTYYIGGQHTIDITPNTCSGDVRLELYKGSENLCSIADISGRWYEWYGVSDCGGGPDTDYRIKATCLPDTACYDFSDYFTISN